MAEESDSVCVRRLDSVPEIKRYIAAAIGLARSNKVISLDAIDAISDSIIVTILDRHFLSSVNNYCKEVTTLAAQAVDLYKIKKLSDRQRAQLCEAGFLLTSTKRDFMNVEQFPRVVLINRLYLRKIEIERITQLLDILLEKQSALAVPVLDNMAASVQPPVIRELKDSGELIDFVVRLCDIEQAGDEHHAEFAEFLRTKSEELNIGQLTTEVHEAFVANIRRFKVYLEVSKFVGDWLLDEPGWLFKEKRDMAPVNDIVAQFIGELLDPLPAGTSLGLSPVMTHDSVTAYYHIFDTIVNKLHAILKQVPDTVEFESDDPDEVVE